MEEEQLAARFGDAYREYRNRTGRFLPKLSPDGTLTAPASTERIMAARPDVTLPRRVTYEDYRHFPDDGMRYEILNGEIFRTPAPSPRHQYTSRRLQRMLEDDFEGSRGAWCSMRRST